MKHAIRSAMCLAWLAVVVVLLTAGQSAGDKPLAHQLTFSNADGVLTTMATHPVDVSNPFFQDIGANGRSCFSCHRPAQGWTISPQEIQERFKKTQGLDPLFRTNDGSNCEGADVSSVAKRQGAFSLLVTKGLIRVGLDVPADAEFEIVAVDDPYGCGAPLTAASMYRRPLPTTNLKFLSAVMWDGRETIAGHGIGEDLITQASHATMGHAEGLAPSPAQLRQIVDLEMGLFSAQTSSHTAGSLKAQHARGGPEQLVDERFCIGINDPLNMLPAVPGACEEVSGGLDPVVFTLFGSWASEVSPQRRSIARGEQLFNTRTFVIDGVGGLNGGPADPLGGPIAGGTCTVCHDTPNAANHSVAMALDLGLTDATRRTADLPLYTLRNKATLETRQTTDPGRAMVSGKWADIAKFKGPVLRALAARPPYFHNGAAATLEEAVTFYDERFNIGFTAQEKADLVAFLKAL